MKHATISPTKDHKETVDVGTELTGNSDVHGAKAFDVLHIFDKWFAISLEPCIHMVNHKFIFPIADDGSFLPTKMK